ncbi:FG-GAP repeat domain-containing protein [Haloarcula halophila]|uniref:FG-GAP repeat domain-containing protein n=1 Tax=Haloarcula TaxID=2237 RepID=UPI0023E4282C|nr:VCBS repeat-containing protein [Halomicroarcula sp. DFY41]
MVSGPSSNGERGVSPVVGGVLLLGIVVLLVGLSSVFVFQLTDEQTPAPETAFDLERTDGAYELVHEAGPEIDGDRVTLRGVADPDVLHGRTLAAGQSVVVFPQDETLRIVWTESKGEPSSYILARFDIAEIIASGRFPGGTVFTGNATGITTISGDGGNVSVVPNASDVEAIGPPKADVTGDGAPGVPYVNSSGAVKLVDATGDVTTVTTNSAVPDGTEDKTRLATGSWNGSPPSVFFVNDTSPSAIYRSTPSSGVTVVATDPGGDGANAVVGPGDIDGDGTDELVFADGSQTLQYLEPGGSVHSMSTSLGSSTGIGAGTMADFDGDGTPRVASVDGGNDVVLTNDTSGDEIGSSDVSGGSTPSAMKATATAADVDGDGNPELVYLEESSSDIKYLDDIDSGTIDIEFLNDTDGDEIDGYAGTGVA